RAALESTADRDADRPQPHQGDAGVKGFTHLTLRANRMKQPRRKSITEPRADLPSFTRILAWRRGSRCATGAAKLTGRREQPSRAPAGPAPRAWGSKPDPHRERPFEKSRLG